MPVAEVEVAVGDRQRPGALEVHDAGADRVHGSAVGCRDVDPEMERPRRAGDARVVEIATHRVRPVERLQRPRVHTASITRAGVLFERRRCISRLGSTPALLRRADFGSLEAAQGSRWSFCSSVATARSARARSRSAVWSRDSAFRSACSALASSARSSRSRRRRRSSRCFAAAAAAASRSGTRFGFGFGVGFGSGLGLASASASRPRRRATRSPRAPAPRAAFRAAARHASRPGRPRGGAAPGSAVSPPRWGRPAPGSRARLRPRRAGRARGPCPGARSPQVADGATCLRVTHADRGIRRGERSLGRSRAARLTASTTAEGLRSPATVAASSLRPLSRSSLAIRRRSSTNRSGATASSLCASSGSSVTASHMVPIEQGQ